MGTRDSRSLKHASIFFPLHNRDKLVGLDYTLYFKQLYKCKSIFNEKLSQVKRVQFQYQAKDDQPDHPTLKPAQPQEEINRNENPEVPEERPENQPELQEPESLESSFDPADRNFTNEEDAEAYIKAKAKTRFVMIYTLEYIDKCFCFSSDKLKRGFLSIKEDLKQSVLGLASSTAQPQPQPALPEKESVESRILDLYKHYYLDNNRVFREMHAAMSKSKPLGLVFPILHNYRSLEDIKHRYGINSKLLKDEFRLTLWNNLQKYPDEAMREYFGSKVSTFFSFMAFYRDWLVLPSVTGLVYLAIELYYRSDSSYDLEEGFEERLYEVSSICYILLICVLKNSFLNAWKKLEATYGEDQDKAVGLEETCTDQRKDFKPAMKRSLVTDKINEPSEDLKPTITLLILSVVVCYTGLTFFLSRLIMLQKRRSAELKLVPDVVVFMNGLKLSSVVFDFVEFVRIQLFQWGFFHLISRLLRLRNLKSVRDHENQLIVCLTVYQLVNNSSILIMLYAEQLWAPFGLKPDGRKGLIQHSCFEDDCYEETSSFFLTYTVFQLLWSVFYKVLFVNYFSKAISKISDGSVKAFRKLTADFRLKLKTMKTVKLGEVEELLQEYLDSVEHEQMKLDPANQLQHAINRAVFESHLSQDRLYFEVNKEIEDQLLLADYSSSADFESTIFDYLSVVNNYSYVILFGAIFSQCFITCWLLGTVETYLCRGKLFFGSKRPVPVASSSIGVWFDLVEMISHLAVPLNALYGSWFIFEDKPHFVRLTAFTALCIAMGFVDSYNSRLRASQEYSSPSSKLRKQNIERSLLVANKEKSCPATHAILLSTAIQKTPTVASKGADIFEMPDADQEEKQLEEEEVKAGLAQVHQRFSRALSGPLQPQQDWRSVSALPQQTPSFYSQA